MASDMVLSRMAINTVYSQNGDVAKDHNLAMEKSFNLKYFFIRDLII